MCTLILKKGCHIIIKHCVRFLTEGVQISYESAKAGDVIKDFFRNIPSASATI